MILTVERRVPGFSTVYAKLGWKMFSSIDRVYVNNKARKILEWRPLYDFQHVIRSLEQGRDPRSELAVEVGSKGYHAEVFDKGPYPVE